MSEKNDFATGMELNEFFEEMSFEAALKELDLIVKRLESGKESLEEAIKSFERGHLLRLYCEKRLQEAQLKIDQITHQSGKEAQLEPFEETSAN